ncbi:hypothetical protein BSL78_18898 [Apostichopus japonicus]|uniref:Uncharacterized protein n=1 Tax=Stichopus japonicus TaxID=307972 RepID=A0A2G8K8F9_STIJA|nr:hypothetical protein BSL78_18898 [Apostichopus japonicus]
MYLIDFKNPIDIGGQLKGFKKEILQKVTDLFKDVGFDHSSSSHDLGTKIGQILFLSGASGRNAAVQIFTNGSVTVNIQIPLSEVTIKELDLHSLAKDMKALMCSKTVKV